MYYHPLFTPAAFTAFLSEHEEKGITMERKETLYKAELDQLEKELKPYERRINSMLFGRWKDAIAKE